MPWMLITLAVAAALRSVAIFDAFWLDEIWSWAWAHHPLIYVENLAALKIESALDIFTKLRHDNNHQLITLWMYLVGDLDQWSIYRLPSMLAGLGTVWLVMERGRGWAGVVLPGGLFATSYLMMVFSTEARGYGLAIFFALLGYRFLERRLRAESPCSAKDSMMFAAIVVLGMSSHFIFAHFFAAAVLWTVVHPLRSQEPGGSIGRLLRLHGLPVLYISILYFGFIRGMQFGGGTGAGIGDTLRDVMAWTSGGPNLWWGAALGGAILVGLAMHGAGRVPNAHNLVFLVGASLIGPALPLLLRSLQAEDMTSLLYPRYFLIAVTFVLLFASRGLLRLFEASGTRHAVALVITVVLVIGNSVRIARFLQHGRGTYAEAVTFMSKNSIDSAGQLVDFSVGSPVSVRSKMTMLYYRRFLPAGQRVGWVDKPEVHPVASAPRWLAIPDPWFAERPAKDRHTAKQMLQLPSGALYRFADEYPFYGPSGFRWQIYGRVR